MERCIVYIGDFDLRNENVQAHLVRNNGKIFNALGYHVEYIGINREEASCEAISKLPRLQLDNGNYYYELPETLNVKGLFKVVDICRAIITKLDDLKKRYKVAYVISYQSPTYAIAIKKVATWCKKNNIFYIVNCADLPIFDLQSPLRKVVMKKNWDYMHKINQRNADGIIAVSKYIAEFYNKPHKPFVIIPPLFDSNIQYTSFKRNEIVTFIYAGTPFKITGQKAVPVGMKDRLDKIIDLFLLLSSNGVKYTLNIVGISKEDYLTGVPRHKTALADENSICFRGRCSHQETLCMIANSDFSVNYRDENLMTKAGFSTKIVESVSLGTPVIINNIGDTFIYLEEGVTGMCLSGDLEEDSLRMSKLCTSSIEERAMLKTKCKESRIFYIENYISNMQNFFGELSRANR